MYSDPHFGSYQSLKDCQADLPGQKETFEHETRLKVSMAYCFVLTCDDAIEMDLPYEARIDGFGKSTRHPFRYATTDSGDAAGLARLKQLQKEILIKMAEQRMTIAHVVIDRQLDGTVANLKILYYSERPLNVPEARSLQADYPARCRFSGAGSSAQTDVLSHP